MAFLDIFPDVDLYRKETALARSEFEKAKRDHTWTEWRTFFAKVGVENPFQVLKKTFEFLKVQKKQKGRRFGSNCNISQFRWLESLYTSVVEGQNLLLLPEDGQSFPAPTRGEVRDIINNFRNGTCPGSDGINVELLKCAPDEFIDELHSLIEQIWNSNVSPAEFLNTVQVPIPKKCSPKSTDDFRKITLCNVVYKVIATFLLQRIDDITGELPTYQAAFMANRCVEDHIFSARRILEEYWNHGVTVIALALDLKQACDSVSHKSVIEALKALGVPAFIVNRVINMALKERTCLRWQNKRTPTVAKGKGVKQGCPLSPRLFSLVLHWLLLRLRELHPEVSLVHDRGLRTPVILAYADDLLIISKSPVELDKLVTTLRRLLEEVGLLIHPEKSELIKRDPYSTKEAPRESFSVGGIQLESKPSFRYLGTYLTATVNRPASVKQRCLQGTRVSKSILPFLLKNKIPWDIGRRVYDTVVVPTVIFGMNAISLTAQNRRSLRRFERKTVQEWYRACGGVTLVSTRKLLNNRTIVNRIKAGRVMFWSHISRREENHLLQAAFNFKLDLPKRKCRPCDTWGQTLDKDLASIGMVRADLAHLLHDKNKLKKEIKKRYFVRDPSDTFHLECLQFNLPEGRFICGEFESGRMHLNDESQRTQT
ncbi:hypothetical protein pipiens_008256 [Culex pipiens pipiens]|uniref:Reverse transcriptase domain-containing protein n=1 Tax=Culex pipiens pipiens TaxID=38569 RepID=A0ABD1DI73_CULPP